MQSQAVTLEFSAAGDQIAYLTQADGEEWALCVNGECSMHQKVGIDVKFVDGKAAYWAVDPAGQLFVYGDKTLGPYDEIWRTKTSTNGKHFILVAKTQGNFLLLIDGREQSVAGEVVGYEIGPGGEVVYAVKSEGKVRVVFDGRDLPDEYDEIQYPTISPDGKHVAFWARRGSSWSVVTDREEYPGFDGYYFYEIGGERYALLWDRASQNLAYMAQVRGVGVIIALNGKQQPDVEISGFTPQVYVDDQGHTIGIQCVGCPSIDRRGFVECLLRRSESSCDPVTTVLAQGEMAYIESGEQKSTMVVGEKREGPYSAIESGLLTSSGDEHYAYVIRTDLGQQVILDGKLMEWAYEGIYRPQFVGDRGFAHLGRKGKDVYSVFYPYP